MEFNKQTITQFIIILVLALALMYKCGDHTGEGYLGETRTDTVKTTHIDTINFTDSIFVDRIFTKFIKDTVFLTPEDSTIFNYKYTTDISDSLLSGNIITFVATDGTLVKQELNYKPKFPKYIYQTDSIIITKETWLKEPSRIIFALGLNSSFNKDNYSIGPSVELMIKNKVNINAGYDLVNKGVTFGLHIPLTNNK